MQLSNELTVVIHKLLTVQLQYEKNEETIDRHCSEVRNLLNKSFDMLVKARQLLKNVEAIRNAQKTG